MHIISIIGIVIASIIILILIAAAFGKKNYSVERNIIINRPASEVFAYIKYLKNQDYYNKWVMMDPAMKKEFKGVDGTVGFVYAWDGNKRAGAGEQEIKSIKENERVDMEIRFIRPFAAVSTSPFITTAVANNQTQVAWGVNSSMKFPMNAMLLFVSMDKLLGKDMETSLTTLKNILEKG
jgi:hypothetical protein